MATITAKAPGKLPRTLRGIAEDDIEMRCAKLEDLGYTRISVEGPSVTAKGRRQAGRRNLAKMYQTNSIESLLG
jgi:hypothetical protein